MVDNDFDGLLNYSFLDKSFMVGYDTVFSPSKLHEFGFPEDRIYEYGSGAECMTAFFQRLVDERIIPDPAAVVSADQPVVTRRRLAGGDVAVHQALADGGARTG